MHALCYRSSTDPFLVSDRERETLRDAPIHQLCHPSAAPAPLPIEPSVTPDTFNSVDLAWDPSARAYLSIKIGNTKEDPMPDIMDHLEPPDAPGPVPSPTLTNSTTPFVDPNVQPSSQTVDWADGWWPRNCS